MSHEKFITDFLNIKPEYLQEIITLKQPDGSLHVKVRLKPQGTTCTYCHKPAKVHGFYSRKLTHSVFNDRKCIIFYDQRRYICKDCQCTFSEKNPFINNSQQLTYITKVNILKDLKYPESTYSSVAQRFNVSVNRVIRIFDEGVDIPRKPLPEVLSIDEFKGNTGYSKYQVALMDNKNKKVLDILPSRKVHELCQYFKKFPTSKRENVKYFITDLWEDYKGIAMTYFPKAKIVADRFHFVRYACNAMDKIRIRVQKNMQISTRKYIKHSKKILMARPFNLNENGTERVTYLLNNFHDDLRTSYLLKEQLLDIIKLPFPALAKKLFKEWIENAENTKIPELIECAKTYRNWLTEIVNSFYVPYNNGVIEGTNNKIKVLKRNSYGCKNFNNFKTRILLCTK